jgi:Flp pilus assembly protein TadD
MTRGEAQVALADCNESLRQHANDPFALESRGLNHLKLGHLANALTDFDVALKLAPKLATSLYGRGTAKLKMGDAVGGNEDISAAKGIRQDIGEEFARYGIQ